MLSKLQSCGSSHRFNCIQCAAMRISAVRITQVGYTSIRSKNQGYEATKRSTSIQCAAMRISQGASRTAGIKCAAMRISHGGNTNILSERHCYGSAKRSKENYERAPELRSHKATHKHPMRSHTNQTKIHPN